MNKRENTFFEATIPNDATISGIRKVSIGSISLLQMLGNPFASVMLSGGDLPLNDPVAIMQFVYLHTAPIEQVTNEVLRYKVEPDIFNKSCLEFGFGISTEKLVECMHDIMNDRDNIQNAKTKSIDENKGTKSKNKHSQV